MASEAKRAKAHKLLKSIHDPKLNPMDYSASLMIATNYLNVNYDNKARKQWIKDYYPDTKFANYLDSEFKMLGNLVRLVNNGNVLSDKHLEMMESERLRLSVPIITVVSDEPVLPKATIQDKMDEKVSNFLGEFAGLVDQYCIDRSIPRVDVLINSMGIRGPMTGKVAAKVQKTMAELRIAIDGTDKQVTEGYSYLKKHELKKLLGIYESLITALGQVKVSTVRKTRAVKVKPATAVAKNVKFKSGTDNGMKSIPPADVIGAKELWAYSTKYKKLLCYKAADGMALTFKGTTLMNFDVEKAEAKTVKKLDEMTKLIGQGTRSWNKYWNDNTSKPNKISGRINEDTVLLAAWK
jgi:hypothetical protein